MQESTEFRVQSADDIVSTKQRDLLSRLYKSVLCTLYSVLSFVTYILLSVPHDLLSSVSLMSAIICFTRLTLRKGVMM